MKDKLRENVKCPDCLGDGYQWLAGRNAHPSNQYKCETCDGSGKIKGEILNAEGDGGAVAWQIETDDDVERVAKESGWDNRRYMTPADYSIWCIRMREFVRIAVDVPQPFTTHPARSGVVSDEDVRDAVVEYQIVAGTAGVNTRGLRAALEHFAKGERHER